MRTRTVLGVLPGMLTCALHLPAATTAVHAQTFVLEVPFVTAPHRLMGEAWVAYELHVIARSGEPVRLRRLAVVDGAGGSVVAGFDETELSGRVAGSNGADGTADPLTLQPGARAVVYLEFPLSRDGAQTLTHRLEVGDEDGHAREVMEGGRIQLREVTSLALGPPLRGGVWSAIYHPAWPRGHRRVFYATDGRARIPGRFAIDFFMIDEQGRVADGDRDVVANWFGYGAEVLAVADGVVAAVRDDVPESSRISTHPRVTGDDATGNFIALDLGDGQFAFYEHLKPGSTTVVPGQPVRRGQVIAALGFTGSTSGPHLHFHVADANSALGAEGLPFVLEHFTLLGTLGDDSATLFGRPWSGSVAPVHAERFAERPPANAVIRFH